MNGADSMVGNAPRVFAPFAQPGVKRRAYDRFAEKRP